MYMLGLKVVHISVFFRPKYIVFGYMDTYRVGAVTVRTGFLEGFLTGVSEASIIRLLQALYGIAYHSEQRFWGDITTY